MLNFMGWTPPWLGGSGGFGVPSHILPGKNGAFATMIASLVYYGRRVKNLDFRLVGPLNEQDWNCLEGPCLAPDQYTSVLEAIVRELDGMGQADVRLVGPDCAGSPDAYLGALRGNAAVARRLDHFGLHAYGNSGMPGPDVAAHDYWLTETAASCGGCDTGSTPSQGEWGFAKDTTTMVLGALENGISGVLVYDGYDSFYYHHNAFGFWGLVAYDQGSHAYSARKRLFANAQIAKFVRPGAVRVSETDSISTLGTTVAFLDTSGSLTIVGYNDATSAIEISGELLNLAPVSSLALYETNRDLDLRQAADVPLSGNQFTVGIPAETFFTLTNYVPSVDAGDGNMVGSGAAGGNVGAAGGNVGGGGDNTTGASGNAGAAGAGPVTSGCGCRTSGGHAPSAGIVLLMLAMLRVRFTRRSTA
jgi:MYXO-CTERM domain-containing protein